MQTRLNNAFIIFPCRLIAAGIFYECYILTVLKRLYIIWKDVKERNITGKGGQNAGENSFGRR